MPKLLIIEDEPKYSYILEKFFQAEGFEVALSFNGLEGLELFKSFNPDVIVLDIMLPKLDGYEVAKRIRTSSNVPIIMMSALSDEKDILKGYELQIDDYVTKPFRTPVLIAKVKNVLSRRETLLSDKKVNENIQGKEISTGRIRLNLVNYECYVNEKLVKLSKTEFNLLSFFIENENRNCTRELLYETLWKDSNTDIRIIDTYIKKLRNIVNEGGCEIITLFGVGYRFEKRN